MNDESRELRYQLGTLCEQYSHMVADKDTVDFRLGSPEPYSPTEQGIDAEGVYEQESHTVTSELRDLITRMEDVVRRIRSIEGF
jgi:hypothetical protein